MITFYIIRSVEDHTPFLATISRERADGWLETANEGGCRSMGWNAQQYEIAIKHRPIKENTGIWQF